MYCTLCSILHTIDRAPMLRECFCVVCYINAYVFYVCEFVSKYLVKYCIQNILSNILWNILYIVYTHLLVDFIWILDGAKIFSNFFRLLLRFFSHIKFTGAFSALSLSSLSVLSRLNKNFDKILRVFCAVFHWFHFICHIFIDDWCEKCATCFSQCIS